MRQQLRWAGEAAATHGNATPCDEEIERLRQLRAEARRRQRKYNAARAEVERTKPAENVRRERDKAKDRERGEAFLNELNRIRL